MEMPIKKINIKEVYNIIQKDLNANKTPGYDLTTSKMLKELPEKTEIVDHYLQCCAKT